MKSLIYFSVCILFCLLEQRYRLTIRFPGPQNHTLQSWLFRSSFSATMINFYWIKLIFSLLLWKYVIVADNHDLNSAFPRKYILPGRHQI